MVMNDMRIAQSRVTAQGQVSVPAEVRRRLGLGPGSVIEWDANGDEVTVRRVGRFTSEDIHRAIFEVPPAPKSLEELKESIEAHMRERYGRAPSRKRRRARD